MGRRMADASAHLVDHVFPRRVPVRQWVLSFPRQIRFFLARDFRLITRALEVFIDEVFKHYRRRFLCEREDADPGEWRHVRRLPWTAPTEGGGVTAVQRYGSSLNLMNRS